MGSFAIPVIGAFLSRLEARLVGPQHMFLVRRTLARPAFLGVWGGEGGALGTSILASVHVCRHPSRAVVSFSTHFMCRGFP